MNEFCYPNFLGFSLHFLGIPCWESHRKFRFIIPIKGQYSNRIKKQCKRINEQLPTIQIKAQFQRCNSNFWDTNIRRRLVINPAPSLADFPLHWSAKLVCKEITIVILYFIWRRMQSTLRQPSSSCRGSSRWHRLWIRCSMHEILFWE